ncbi:20S proteasome subunit beta 4 [Cryptococcus neoformans]|nr:20S proteasome subunit beta 4 [Cryptococcus neoformans var. grubii Th84]OXH15320.1 20S proteasome subunit beta 4 [Cryptococcus neoformans var. grubii]OXH35757.1 20S proteasome subunit beta 4 [Cryptococcus neoformans var. grubii]OXH56340.1 20S proteasome subunit beta 4 [Cryptococcus neoformans var. grubii]OXH56436.1 20S proteasome subunit beta 4 [Cryptococcus neoformans var. grubii]
MECSFGITGKDYVILASDMGAGRSIVRMKSDENKLKTLGPHLAMAFSGEPGDTNNFAEYIERNMRLYNIRNHFPLLPPAASAWVRRTLAEAIRSRHPYAVNLLLGGFDTTTSKPHLYWIDYLGTKAIVPYAAHGMGVYVSLSTMDKWWYEDMDKREGVDLLRKCIDETEKRLTIKFDFNCILIDKNGIHKVDLSQADPIVNIQEHPQETQVEAPHPPIEVGVSA